MAAGREVEIKFRVDDLRTLKQRLRGSGFHLKTRRTHEMNTLYDLASQDLRKRGELLRLRQYGSEWLLTHKAKGKPGRHKTRVETETHISDGENLDRILRALGYRPMFRYEKFRAEWSDGTGHIVVDETPIGNFGEIEGPPRWIDRAARALGIRSHDYITQTYAELFFGWRKQSRTPAQQMTFSALSKTGRPRWPKTVP